MSPALPTDFRRVWRVSLACFVLAGAAGVLFRYGMLYGYPDGISELNLRHAHSHLMFFRG
jgi:hypothetical protein